MQRNSKARAGNVAGAVLVTGQFIPSMTRTPRGAANLNDDAGIVAFACTFEIVTRRVRPLTSTISNCRIV